MRLTGRLKRLLERTKIARRECPAPELVTSIMDRETVEIPDDAPSCKYCGEPHALVIVEEIVDGPEGTA